MKKILIPIAGLFVLSLNAQTAEEIAVIREHYEKTTDKELLQDLNQRLEEREQRIVDYLNATGKERRIKDGDRTLEIFEVTEEGPIYYTNYNRGAARTIRAEALNSGGSTGLNLNGQGMNVGVWDAGTPLHTHVDMADRMTSIDQNFDPDDHATHVMGTVMSSGNSTPPFQGYPGRGIAYEANGRFGNWTNDLTEMMNEAQINGLLVSNHSYGYNYDALPRWRLGAYDQEAKNVDDIANLYDHYQMVIAAGNDRGQYNTYNPGKNGYDMLSSKSVAKNVITVGAVNEVIEYTGPSNVQMSSFSNWGPTDDGRIKPDVVAKGVGTYSCVSTGDTAYASLSGTSMATPSVSGLLILLQQYNNQINDQFLKAATLKGLLLHTADETGLFPGPDYRYGWGLPNGITAANALFNHGVSSYVYETSLNNGETETFTITATGNEPLKVSISWTDPSGTATNNQEDLTTPALVNDLDIVAEKSGVQHYPWKLNLAQMDAGATRTSTNDVDNYERIDIDTPAANDVYQVSVSHKGTLRNNTQNFSVIVTGGTVSGLATNDIRENAADISIYPNPTVNEMNIAVKDNTSIKHIELFDVTGKMIKMEQFNRTSSNLRMNVEGLAPGVYMVKIHTDSGIVYKKIIKK